MSGQQHEDAAFVAAITASSTHEIRNVLAIVKECAGLMADMVHACDDAGSLDTERLLRVVSRIDTQVGRGADLITGLNHFVHTLDAPEATIELQREVAQAVLLSQRTARLRNHTVTHVPSPDALSLTLSPFRLHMALFTAIECCMDRLTEPGTVVLRALQQERRAAVEVTGEIGGAVAPGTAGDGDAWTRLRGLVDDLAGSLTNDDTCCRFRIGLPG